MKTPGPRRPSFRLSVYRTSAAVLFALASASCGTPVVSPSSVAPASTGSLLLADAARVWCSRNEDALDEAASVLGLEALPKIARVVASDEFVDLVRAGTIVSVFIEGFVYGVESDEEGFPFNEVIKLDPNVDYDPDKAQHLLTDISAAADEAGTPDESFWIEGKPFVSYTEDDYARACQAAFQARD